MLERRHADIGVRSVAFPHTFPNGILSIQLTAGDTTGAPGYLTISAGTTNTAGFTYVTSAGTSSTFRINYRARGF